MLTATTVPELSDAELSQYAQLIYDTTGNVISSKKKQLLSNRLRRRLRATGLTSFGDYLRHLRRLPAANPEWDAFLQEITTHETYLFRDKSHWDWFRETFLPETVRQANAGARPKSLRIWSAACSTGDEACTIATCIADRLPDPSQWEIDILGTDIGIDAVRSAQAARFNQRAMQYVPEKYRRRYFSKARNAQLWTARSNVTRWTRFRQHNLLSPLHEAPFDVVFMKNVLIYFDRQSKQQVLNHVRRLLRPGSTLITGAAEGVASLIKDLTRETGWRHRAPELSGNTPINSERA